MQQNHDRSEMLTAFLDGELPAGERALVERELQADPGLRRQYDVLAATRGVVRGRASTLREAMPVELERSIRMALGREVAAATEPAPTMLDRILGLLRQPAYAVGAAAVILATVIYVTMDRNTAGQSAFADAALVNVYDASYSNFKDLVQGDMHLAKESSDRSELAAFFKSEGVDYTVFFPEIDADLKGGVVSDHGGKRFAHLVYGVGNHLVYIFEVDEASVANKSVAMNEQVAQDLAQSRWHWEERSGVGTMFVWESNNVICSAVSDLRTQDLSALFTLEKL